MNNTNAKLEEKNGKKKDMHRFLDMLLSGWLAEWIEILKDKNNKQKKNICEKNVGLSNLKSIEILKEFERIGVKRKKKIFSFGP